MVARRHRAPNRHELRERALRCGRTRRLRLPASSSPNPRLHLGPEPHRARHGGATRLSSGRRRAAGNGTSLRRPRTRVPRERARGKRHADAGGHRPTATIRIASPGRRTTPDRTTARDGLHRVERLRDDRRLPRPRRPEAFRRGTPAVPRGTRTGARPGVRRGARHRDPPSTRHADADLAAQPTMPVAITSSTRSSSNSRSTSTRSSHAATTPSMRSRPSPHRSSRPTAR